jgi:hypothetical protein
LEDVLVKVDQFILPAVFIVLDMEEAPIILGGLFMTTADTKICVKKGAMSIKVNGEKIEFKVFDALKLPQDNLDCFNVCVIQSAVEEAFQVHHIDPLEATLTHSFTRQDIEPDVTNDIFEAIHFLEASPPHPSKYVPPFETLVPNITTLVPSIV